MEPRVDLSDNRASRSATATSQNNIAAVDVDGFVVISIGIDEKFTRWKEDNATAVGFCGGNGTYDGALVRQMIIGDSTITGDVEYGMCDIGNRFGEVVIARVGKVG